jgi:hypothetical protein
VTEGEAHLATLIWSERAGVFASLRDETVFDQVEVQLGAVVWPGTGIDLAPDAMYDAIKVRGVGSGNSGAGFPEILAPSAR